MKSSILTLFIFTILYTTTPVAEAYTGMTAEQLRTEIARLTRVADTIKVQLVQFGSNPNTVLPGTSNPNSILTPSILSNRCLQTNLRMSKGDKGGSVSTLQDFLVKEGVYAANLVTGYFGPATQAGVQRWQAAHGIVSYGSPSTTGYGRVGPSTLRAMQSGCLGGRYTGISGSLTDSTIPTTSPKGVAVEKYSLSLNPTSGIAPLAVTASFEIDGSTCTSYLLDWGDGSIPVLHNSNKDSGCVSKPIKITQTHIYNSPGTHTVIFKAGKANLSQIKQLNALKVNVVGNL